MAITSGDSNATGFQSGNSGTVDANNACAPGDLIEVQFILFNAAGANVAPTVSDDVNSGDYTIVETAMDSSYTWQYGKAYIVCNASGVPTITVDSDPTNFSGMEISFSRYTGFTGIPKLDAAATSSNSGNSGTPTCSFVGTQINELVIANGFGSNAMTVGGSWAALLKGGAFLANVFEIAGAPGTSSFSATLASSQWDVMMSGYYSDAGTAELAAAATEAATVASALVNWSSVTLSGSLYSGVGGLLDPAIRYPNRQPQDGDVVYFDPTHLTVLADGELVGDISDFVAVVQFNDGVAMQQIAITFTSGLVAHPTETQVALGALSTAIIMAAAASEATAAGSSLADSAAAALHSAASEVAAAMGVLNTGKPIAAASAVNTFSVGALTTLISFASSAFEMTAAVAELAKGAQLTGAAQELSTGRARLGPNFPRVAPFRILRIPPIRPTLN